MLEVIRLGHLGEIRLIESNSKYHITHLGHGQRAEHDGVVRGAEQGLAGGLRVEEGAVPCYTAREHHLGQRGGGGPLGGQGLASSLSMSLTLLLGLLSESRDSSSHSPFYWGWRSPCPPRRHQVWSLRVACLCRHNRCLAESEI